MVSAANCQAPPACAHCAGNIARGSVTNVSSRTSSRPALSAKWENTARSTEVAHIFATSWKKKRGINRNLQSPTVNSLIANLLIGTQCKPHFNPSTRKDLSSKPYRTIAPFVLETLMGPDLSAFQLLKSHNLPPRPISDLASNYMCLPHSQTAQLHFRPSSVFPPTFRCTCSNTSADNGSQPTANKACDNGMSSPAQNIPASPPPPETREESHSTSSTSKPRPTVPKSAKRKENISNPSVQDPLQFNETPELITPRTPLS
jgi:hypothetical protein